MLVKGSEEYWLHVFDDHLQPDPYISQGEVVSKEKMRVTHMYTGVRTTVTHQVGMSYQEMFNEGKRRIEAQLQERATQAAKQGEQQ